MSEPRRSLRVQRISWEAPGVVSLDLIAPDDSALPAPEPGAHLDLHLPGGITRPYSLCGESGWRVAVREIADGRASRFIHRELRVGAIIEATGPRNNFRFDAAQHYLFIAGGIGITPLLPMLRAATRAGATWELHLCTHDADAPLIAEARAAGGTVHHHISTQGTRLDVAELLATPRAGTLVYCCGPAGLMLAVEQAGAHWPAGSLRFEWFAARPGAQDGAQDSFELLCAASGHRAMVSAGVSVLETLRGFGLDVPSSCEQGVCGTCECRVLEGSVDHRDSILSAAERAEGRVMMTCVSRAASPRLVLDI